MTIQELTELKDSLKNRLRWTIFGGYAIALWNSGFYREHDDIDIIVEDKEDVLKSIFPNIDNSDRRGRKRRKFKNYDFIFETNPFTIQLADGKFEYKRKFINFEDISFPVVDIESLFSSKNRHLSQLVSNDHPKKNSTIKDITTAERVASLVKK